MRLKGFQTLPFPKLFLYLIDVHFPGLLLKLGKETPPLPLQAADLGGERTELEIQINRPQMDTDSHRF